MARHIKLSGRELGVMRAVGFGLGITGAEIEERTRIEADELVDILNSMLDMGYLETPDMKQRVSVEDFAAETFEINPSYTNELKAAMRFR